jgi:DNA polymerase
MADAERRAAYLGVLGIDHWVSRRAPAPEPPMPLSGVGDRDADWMIVGDAPEMAGDRQGLPFAGPAGQLLDAMLGAIGLSREAVFIAECRAHLLQQVAMVRPRIILAFGPVAAQGLLGPQVALDGSLDGLRGAVHRFGGANTPVVVTYHPAALLQSPGDKRKAWEDLKFARQVRAGLEPIRE